MGLGYPGGPALSRLAEQGDPQAFKLPRPLLHSGDLDFSFAGLKTAVLTQAKKLGPELEARKADLAAATQAAIVEVLVQEVARRAGPLRPGPAGGRRWRRRQQVAAEPSSKPPLRSADCTCTIPKRICAPTTAP